MATAGLASRLTGSTSLVSVFSLMLLTVLLGMVINTSRQVDSKVRLQNAADAATYSGGAALVRGMDGIAFTNHMLSDVFGSRPSSARPAMAMLARSRRTSSPPGAQYRADLGLVGPSQIQSARSGHT